ncbi:MAG TPA: hypothetical protein VHU42_00565 [Rhodopila sp.]|jgi:hypothetical protein|nr:hypothetical protein [Rhodopila sp.]
MLRSLLSTAIICGTVLVSGPSFAASLDQLKSPNVDLPTSDTMFPDGPGADEINGSCLACHSADHILNQPLLTREAWQEVVNKMIKAYKAPIDPASAAKIVDYLARTKGKS